MKHSEATFDASRARRHELRDVPVRAVLWFVLCFIIGAAIIHLSAGVLFKYMASAERNTFPAEAPVVQLDRVPGPRLQISPRQDLERFRAGEATNVPKGRGPQ